VTVNILVADDSVTMRRILELTFQGEDARVTSVENGESAVRKASELKPDLVFADLSLSGLDGYAIASAIKSTAGLEHTAVIAMASQKHPYDEDKGKAAGVDDHIIKPFDTQHVIDRVKQVLSKPRTGSPTTTPATTTASSAPLTTSAPALAPAAAAIPEAAPANRFAGTKPIAFGGKAPAPANTADTQAPVPVSAPRTPPLPASAAPFSPANPAPSAKPAVPAAAGVAPIASAATAAATPELERKLSALGLTAEQAEAILKLSREVIERVVWEVVPDLAETLIKEEIRRLTAD